MEKLFFSCLIFIGSIVCLNAQDAELLALRNKKRAQLSYNNAVKAIKGIVTMPK